MMKINSSTKSSQGKGPTTRGSRVSP